MIKLVRVMKPLKQLKDWVKTLSKGQQVTVFCAVLVSVGGLGGTLITAISPIIITLINKECNETAAPTPIPPTPQHPEVERLNAEILGYLKAIDNIQESDISKKQQLLNIVFNHLNESITIDPNDGETYFLYAEAHLRDKDYTNAFSNYAKALENKYSYECDVHFGYGHVYEALGDKDLSNIDFSSADVHYKRAIDYLSRAINNQNLSFYRYNVNEAKEMVSQIEQKKEIYKYNEIFHLAFSPNINLITNYDVYLGMEELARSFTDKKLWKNATLCYYWLFRQNNITGQRRMQNTESLRYVSERWEYSDNFIHDISNNSVHAIINSNNVNFRKTPTMVDSNIFREFNLYEEIRVLQRSDFKQTIGNVNAYWYKVRADDDIEGWVYGQYLFFYPDFPFP